MSTGFKEQLHWFLLKIFNQTLFESILQNTQGLFRSLKSQFKNGSFVVQVIHVTLLALKKLVLCQLTTSEIVSSVFLNNLISFKQISFCMPFPIH